MLFLILTHVLNGIHRVVSLISVGLLMSADSAEHVCAYVLLKSTSPPVTWGVILWQVTSFLCASISPFTCLAFLEFSFFRVGSISYYVFIWCLAQWKPTLQRPSYFGSHLCPFRVSAPCSALCQQMVSQ